MIIFWLGQSLNQVPQGPFRQTKNPRVRVEFVQKIVDSFWNLWTRDVFLSLIPQKKWNTETRYVQVDGSYSQCSSWKVESGMWVEWLMCSLSMMEKSIVWKQRPAVESMRGP